VVLKDPLGQLQVVTVLGTGSITTLRGGALGSVVAMAIVLYDVVVVRNASTIMHGPLGAHIGTPGTGGGHTIHGGETLTR
jgi:hypothetical protein